MSKDEHKTIYQVIYNYEEYYSIWPVDRPIPMGWKPLSFRPKQGTQEECLKYIEEVLGPEQRPLSLRMSNEEFEKHKAKFFEE
ncbi:MAG: MbtH family protein [Leptolyngbya sp. SIO3F4]|nr:MbtH family protein [Leptolyngbya sp. SIO3F4]